MNIAFTGKSGQGKSYTLIAHVILPALKAGRCVRTNIPIDDARLRSHLGFRAKLLDIVSTEEARTMWRDKRPGLVHVYDEAAFIAGAHQLRSALTVLDDEGQPYQMPADERRAAILTLTTGQRHDIQDVYWGVQSFDALDKGIRDNCHMILECISFQMLDAIPRWPFRGLKMWWRGFRITERVIDAERDKTYKPAQFYYAFDVQIASLYRTHGAIHEDESPERLAALEEAKESGALSFQEDPSMRRAIAEWIGVRWYTWVMTAIVVAGFAAWAWWAFGGLVPDFEQDEERETNVRQVKEALETDLPRPEFLPPEPVLTRGQISILEDGTVLQPGDEIDDWRYSGIDRHGAPIWRPR